MGLPHIANHCSFKHIRPGLSPLTHSFLKENDDLGVIHAIPGSPYWVTLVTAQGNDLAQPREANDAIQYQLLLRIKPEAMAEVRGLERRKGEAEEEKGDMVMTKMSPRQGTWPAGKTVLIAGNATTLKKISPF